MTSKRKTGRELSQGIPMGPVTRIAFLFLGLHGFLFPRKTAFEILKKIAYFAAKELQALEQEDLEDLLEFIASAKW